MKSGHEKPRGDKKKAKYTPEYNGRRQRPRGETAQAAALLHNPNAFCTGRSEKLNSTASSSAS